jgi:hypothetical protein
VTTSQSKTANIHPEKAARLWQVSVEMLALRP